MTKKLFIGQSHCDSHDQMFLPEGGKNILIVFWARYQAAIIEQDGYFESTSRQNLINNFVALSHAEKASTVPQAMCTGLVDATTYDACAL